MGINEFIHQLGQRQPCHTDNGDIFPGQGQKHFLGIGKADGSAISLSDSLYFCVCYKKSWFCIFRWAFFLIRIHVKT